LQDTQEIILYTISQIPCGRVSSYGAIARLAGFPGGARQVGRTLKHLPKGSAIPWHRVLRSDGKIAFPKDSEAFYRQTELLLAEDVDVKNGRVNLRHFGWPD